MPRYIYGATVGGSEVDIDRALALGQYHAEDVTISVDTGSGVDDGAIIRTQQEATDHGPFLSLAGALAALPGGTRPGFVFRIDLDATTHVIPEIDLRNFEGFLRIVGAAMTQAVAGTFAVASSSAPDLVTLGVDPGVGVNALQGTYARVTSGTGVGQVLPVRFNNGTAIEFSGSMADSGVGVQLDNTSVLEFVNNSTTIDWQNANARGLVWSRGVNAEPFLNQFSVEREGIEIVECQLTNTVAPLAQNSVEFTGLSAKLERCQATCGFLVGVASIMLQDRVVQDFAGNPTIMSDYCRIIYRHGLQLNADFDNISSSNVTLNSQNMCYEMDAAQDAFELLTPFGSLELTGFHKGTGSLFGVDIKDGSRLTCDSAALAAQAGALTGGTNDFSVDNDGFSWADLDAAPDKIIVGKFGSIADGNG